MHLHHHQHLPFALIYEVVLLNLSRSILKWRMPLCQLPSSKQINKMKFICDLCPFWPRQTKRPNHLNNDGNDVFTRIYETSHTSSWRVSFHFAWPSRASFLQCKQNQFISNEHTNATISLSLSLSASLKLSFYYIYLLHLFALGLDSFVCSSI